MNLAEIVGLVDKTRSDYPRAVSQVHQIELTTKCNLRCKYCPHFPVLPRAQEHMTWETFSAALDLVRFFVKAGTQTELSLTGIGESLLHPRFVDAVAASREVIGDRPLVVTTNGVLFDDVVASSIAPYKPQVFVSLHRPEKAGPAIEIAKRYGILHGVNNSFATSSFNWAGTQKNWFVSAPQIVCEYLRSGWCVVLVDGRVATCCLDASGASVIGSVNDDPSMLKLKPWGDKCTGCSACHMRIP